MLSLNKLNLGGGVWDIGLHKKCTESGEKEEKQVPHTIQTHHISHLEGYRNGFTVAENNCVRRNFNVVAISDSTDFVLYKKQGNSWHRYQ